MPNGERESRWELAKTICRAAGQQTLRWFRQDDLAVDVKADRSPVTEADRTAEQFLRERIADHFPNDGVLGEEFGEQIGGSDFRWILDPIDGTRSFIRGVPLFGTMVGVEAGGEPLIGVLYFPGLDESIWAMRGAGAWHALGEGQPRRARVSSRMQLVESVIVTSDTASFAKRGSAPAWQALESQCGFTRTWGDAYGYLLVATGRVEAMIDPILSVWDAAAVMPIVVEAGGTFSDWNGHPRIDSGDACGSNGNIHREILFLLSRQSDS